MPVDPASIGRSTLYKAGAATGLLFAAVPLVAWREAGRPLESFGAGWVGDPLATFVAALAWAMPLAGMLAAVRRGRLRAPLVRLYRRYAYVMPRNGRELTASWATSLAAGAGEEIAFRGFLLVYWVALAGMPAGLLIATLLFGAAHSYQRLFGMVFATLAGLLLAGAYLASGSLLLVIWIHATWNIASFTVGYTLRAATGEAEPAPL